MIEFGSFAILNTQALLGERKGLGLLTLAWLLLSCSLLQHFGFTANLFSNLNMNTMGGGNP
ncbi:hypothetical protein C5E22_11850 [Pectobacterium parmentieri]|uniref:Uncharacterized protein n=1 Tax=Pectobacterium parmentieri TaxID=1905730 RepID=A0A8B3FBB6_PECPM|nr:hypothetical protein A8F97_07770 [Pectobacterium parmentieri]AYH01394.1 hypothetical protein C5E26_10865 [Pectobacterium parmentieri]AYH05659.1 hypothetical protein C5E25_10040 [Pectobacterium parmentieri]AYH10159.1 hypothetical protein C5E24_10940 [Pectobacterium parmentieri]AYH14480.1 hypothetical protein C5E23_10010 [Pectobacterium parmentieri]